MRLQQNKLLVIFTSRNFKDICTSAPLRQTGKCAPPHVVKSMASSFILLSWRETWLSWHHAAHLSIAFLNSVSSLFDYAHYGGVISKLVNWVRAEFGPSHERIGSIARSWERNRAGDPCWKWLWSMFCHLSLLTAAYESGNKSSGCRRGSCEPCPGVWRINEQDAGLYQSWTQGRVRQHLWRELIGDISDRNPSPLLKAKP